MVLRKEGTIVKSTRYPEGMEYVYKVDGNSEKPWVSHDVPDVVRVIFGADGSELRFTEKDIESRISDGSLRIIHTP